MLSPSSPKLEQKCLFWFKKSLLVQKVSSGSKMSLLVLFPGLLLSFLPPPPLTRDPSSKCPSFSFSPQFLIFFSSSFSVSPSLLIYRYFLSLFHTLLKTPCTWILYSRNECKGVEREREAVFTECGRLKIGDLERVQKRDIQLHKLGGKCAQEANELCGKLLEDRRLILRRRESEKEVKRRNFLPCEITNVLVCTVPVTVTLHRNTCIVPKIKQMEAPRDDVGIKNEICISIILISLHWITATSSGIKITHQSTSCSL